jgi:Tol biopolymer transport system component/DNA-binding winged helix-turn-helix (wHTH) protein
MELPGPVYRFGRFVLDPSNVRLTADGAVCPLEPKSFRLLEFLVENRQRVVSKEELLTAVWEGVAVSDNALTRAMAQVRKALDDDPKNPKYIETVPTVGYRFLATVEEEEAPAGPSPGPSPGPPPAASRKLIWGAAAATVLLVAGWATARFFATQTPDQTSLQAVPFTAYPGAERYPTFSPDGSQVAFTWNGERQDNYDIYVKSMSSETPLRLTTGPEMDARPQWSPDGRYIAFERHLPGGRTALMLIPPLGGAERKLAEFTYVSAQAIGMVSNVAIASSGLSWSRDGKWLAVSGDFTGDGTDRINLVSAETGEARPLTQPPSKDLNDYEPSFSPYSNDLVFERSPVFSAETLYRLSLDDNFVPQGEPVRIYAGKLRAFSPAWVSGGKELVILSGLAGASFGGSVYRLPAAGASSLTQIPSLGTVVSSFAVSRDGRRAAYSVGTRNANIWRIDSSGAAKPETFIVSTKREVHPQYSPDGQRIVFYSNRSGSTQIWVCEADGSKPVMITNLPNGIVGSPRWSPDGRTVVFDSNITGRFQIYTVGAEGGRIRQLTNGATPSFAASYSRDGKWIYYSVTEAQAPAQVWKIPAQGGTPVRVTRHGGSAPQESLDGATLFYVKQAGVGSLWRMPLAGGEEKQIASSIFRSNYALTSKGIYLMSGPAIELLNPDTGERKTILQTKNPDLGLAVSPDGRYVLWSQVDAIGSDLMLVEKFR